MKIEINRKRHMAYFKSVVRHKWFVFKAGREIGVPIIWLLLHDWDKFMPWMWFPYARCFYAPDGTKQYIETGAFNVAWNGHQKLNKHHWQYWLLKMDNGDVVPVPMPLRHIKEMFADWQGAGMAYGNPDTRGWYLERREMFYKVLHIQARFWIESYLGIYN